MVNTDVNKNGQGDKIILFAIPIRRAKWKCDWHYVYLAFILSWFRLLYV